MAAILSLHYGNMYVPNNERSLFSDCSKKHIPHINALFQSYYKRIGIIPKEKIEVVTYRTGLELWRQIFAIHTEDFKDIIAECDIELTLFRVILALNEKIVSFNNQKELYKLDELMFLNGFLTNDTNNYSLKTVLQPQMYYFHLFFDYIPFSNVLGKAAEVLFNNWGIKSWQQYYTTIIWLAYETDKYYQEKQNGVPIIPLDKMRLNDETGLFSPSLVEYLSINEDEYIPYREKGASKIELNIDYRRFRSIGWNIGSMAWNVSSTRWNVCSSLWNGALVGQKRYICCRQAVVNGGGRGGGGSSPRKKMRKLFVGYLNFIIIFASC